VANFSFNLVSAAILFPSIMFLAVIMVRFPRFQYPPLFVFGALSFLYLALEATIEYMSLLGGLFPVAVQLHRISELVAAGLIAPLMFLLDRLFRLPRPLRRVTRVLMWGSVGFTAALAVIAFAVPDWFVSVTLSRTVDQVTGLPAGGRGQYGIVYQIRNAYLAFFAPYTLVAMAFAGRRRARFRRVWLIAVGTAAIIITGLDDVVQTFTHRYFYLNSLVFSRFSLGITVFMVVSMLAIMARFAEYSREVHDAAQTLRIHRDRLRDLATLDQLTGLPNRDVLMTELGRPEHRSLILVDVDFFRTVNDAYGRTRADKLLRVIADRVATFAKGGDAVYRIGPDRFALLSVTAETQSVLGDRAQAIVTDIRVPVFADGLSVYVTASAGAVSGGPGDGADSVLSHAEIALEDAKVDRNGARVFTPQMEVSARRTDRIVERLNRAILNNELGVVYQPIFDRALKPVSVEALVRWTDEELGVVEPRDFIPVSEDSGLIVPLTEFVIANTLGDLIRLPADSGITVNVNISRHQLESHQFFDYLTEMVDFAKPGRAPLSLEVSEDALVRELAGALPALEELHSHGVRVLLDDFGAGFSSLAMLTTLPIHGVKLDPRFIQIDPATEDVRLLQNMVRMAHRLGLSVAAEGIESQSQLDLLMSLDVDYFQGNFLGRPEDFDLSTSQGVPVA